jgi:hypothetical protein
MALYSREMRHQRAIQGGVLLGILWLLYHTTFRLACSWHRNCRFWGRMLNCSFGLWPVQASALHLASGKGPRVARFLANNGSLGHSEKCDTKGVH